MGTIRLPFDVYAKTQEHLFGSWGEHFLFFLAHWTYSQGEPVFLVHDVILIPDNQRLLDDDNEFEVGLNADDLLPIINIAIRNGDCIIEAHNHGGVKPRFSRTDRRELGGFVEYIHSSLPQCPYAATVWSNSTVYGEYFLPDGKTGVIKSITVVGDHLQQIVSDEHDGDVIETTYDRQLPFFTSKGQQQLANMRFGIVGCGGTGSHVIQHLAYLGGQNFVLIDHDLVEQTNLNRLVTATLTDIGASKVAVGERLIRSISSDATVSPVFEQLQTTAAMDALRGVDVIFGCVDNDGARLILNDMAKAYAIPYIDVSTGIEAANGNVAIAGGRVAVILPDGPCLMCLDEIDQTEANYFLSSVEDQQQQIDRGYIEGVNIPDPSVVSLNATIASIAINEFAVLMSGIRAVNILSDYDFVGKSRPTKAQWLTPVEAKQNQSCVVCNIYAGKGDLVSLGRYVTISDD